MCSFYQKLLDQGFVLVYFDDILLLAHSKTHILDETEQLHQMCSSNNLKIAPEKSLLFHSLSNFLNMKLTVTL